MITGFSRLARHVIKIKTEEDIERQKIKAQDLCEILYPCYTGGLHLVNATQWYLLKKCGQFPLVVQSWVTAELIPDFAKCCQVL